MCPDAFFPWCCCGAVLGSKRWGTEVQWFSADFSLCCGSSRCVCALSGSSCLLRWTTSSRDQRLLLHPFMCTCVLQLSALMWYMRLAAALTATWHQQICCLECTPPQRLCAPTLPYCCCFEFPFISSSQGWCNVTLITKSKPPRSDTVFSEVLGLTVTPATKV